MRQAKVVPSDPEWERMKVARRSLQHDEAVQEVVFLQRQTLFPPGDRRVSSPPVDLIAVLKTLAQKRVPFVVTGAHGIAAWTGRPRNTQDIDLLVKPGRNHTRAVNAIRALYPHLVIRQFPGGTAFFVPGQSASVIDVTYPHRPDLEETLAHPAWTENLTEGFRYRVPRLEEALANKYDAMLTSTRALDKRMQDAVDFTRMVQHSTDEGQRPIDLERLGFLGAKVWPAGGANELLGLVEQVKAGRAIHLDALG